MPHPNTISWTEIVIGHCTFWVRLRGNGSEGADLVIEDNITGTKTEHDLSSAKRQTLSNALMRISGH